MLELKDVSKIYRVGTFGGKELHAINHVSFKVNDGEVVSLIGESGSGKSTIGKMVLRLLSISSGQILFDQKNITEYRGNSLKEYYRKVQGVFQDPFGSYNPIFKADRIFSVIHEEFFPGVDKSTWDSKVCSSLASVGLNPEHVLDKFPHQLSGGQLQRFLIARALLLESHFLVADEIISMLDASTRIDVLNLLADLKKRSFSVLFITHDLSLGYYISEQAVILYRGCVVEMGKTEMIYGHPLHPYTQMLMKSIPRIDGRWEDLGSEADRCVARDSLIGCPYYARCTAAMPGKCDKDRPSLMEVEEGHSVACWLYQ